MHLEQLVDARVVALLRAVDGLLRQVVAQHVARVRGVHPRAALRRVAARRFATRAA